MELAPQAGFGPPNSALTRWFQARFGSGGQRLRRAGIVALARRLAIAWWRYTAQGIVAELTRQGSWKGG